MLDINKQEFEKIIAEALEGLPEKFKNKLNNVAIFAEDEPTDEQLNKIRLKRGDILFGLFEGYSQAKRLNIGPVLPDRITIFREAILSQSDNQAELKQKIISTVKHEIAHHFGSDEKGAAKAGKR
ncbi:metallopeptidase family protein [Candidatus Falkowbacteria bacterium]|nr:metallopeptidase family protein [Candidatus Falkowbacteria bacterium]